jgi:hypothetical protein
MVLPVVAAVGRGLVQGAGAAVKGAANIAKSSVSGVARSAKNASGKSAESAGSAINRAGISTPIRQQTQLTPRAQTIKRPPALAQRMQMLARQQSGEEHRKVGGIGTGMGIAQGNAAGGGALNMAKNLFSGDTLGTRIVLNAFTFSSGSFNPALALLIGTPLCFILWSNYIAWHLLSGIRPILLKPIDGITYPITLMLFTFLYILQMLFLLAIIILLLSALSVIGNALNFLPEPLRNLFKL